jgi:RNA polymerase sigma-70 factor (ECF subfamily)
MTVSHDEPKTSAAMLEEMRDPSNREAWARFVGRYEKVIGIWCRKRGLQDADADDVTQKIMLILLDEMPEFIYDPTKGRFRDWPRVITRHACYRFFERDVLRKYKPILDDVQARDELARSLEEQERLQVLHAAMEEVRKRVSHRDWRIFHEVSFGGRSGDELAKELGMTISAVYKAASRVRERVIAQVKEFGGSDSDVESTHAEMPR